MAFAWLAEYLFEDGTDGDFDTETDTAGILDFPHYTELARFGLAPYRGAYCMRVRLNGGTTSAYVIETGTFDTAADGTIFVAFYFYLSRDFTMANSDKVMLFDLESVANTTSEVAAGIDRSGSDIRIWVAETASATAETVIIGTLDAPGHPNSCLGKWHHLEIKANIDAGGGNDGTIDAYWNGVQFGSQITALDQAAIVDARFGTIGPDAGTRGTILFDNVVADDGRIFPHKNRFPHEWTITKTEHVFVGPGHIASAALLTLTSGDALKLFDTDQANVDDAQGFIVELSDSTHVSAEGPYFFERGCYAVLTGTTARAQVIMQTESDRPGLHGPLYQSHNGMVRWGLQRKPKSYGI